MLTDAFAKRLFSMFQRILTSTQTNRTVKEDRISKKQHEEMMSINVRTNTEVLPDQIPNVFVISLLETV